MTGEREMRDMVSSYEVIPPVLAPLNKVRFWAPNGSFPTADYYVLAPPTRD